MHVAALTDSNCEKFIKSTLTGAAKSPVSRPSKPNVLLLGTSNIKNINEAKLSDAVAMQKVVKYTIEDTMTYIKSHEVAPDVVILHSLTNDLKSHNPQTCVAKLEELVSCIRDKWPNCKIIISLTTPRKDDIVYHTNGQIINALLKQKIIGDPARCISYCEHSNMLSYGNPVDNLLTEDKFHLSERGVSMLASNLKREIHSVLKIPMPAPHRRRSRSRGPKGRGRGARDSS